MVNIKPETVLSNSIHVRLMVLLSGNREESFQLSNVN